MGTSECDNEMAVRFETDVRKGIGTTMSQGTTLQTNMDKADDAK